VTCADSLIRELAARHGNHDASFLTAIRPMVERILDDAPPEGSPADLLELLTEIFEREAMLRRELEAPAPERVSAAAPQSVHSLTLPARSE
jgi:hypothetical protein